MSAFFLGAEIFIGYNKKLSRVTDDVSFINTPLQPSSWGAKRVMKTRIRQLYENGYIKKKESILFLANQLYASDPETRELVARTIIEEVVGSKYMGLRLRALDILRQTPPIEPYPDASCKNQIDFHTHSAMFDGYYTPTALILEAFEKGLAAVAITDHNKPPFDENIEAERAAEKLGFCFYKGSEISADFYSDITQSLETVHILDIPAHPPKSPKALLKCYTRDFSNLGYLSDLMFPLISKSALLYTDYCTKKQVKRMLGRFTTQYGHYLALSEKDLQGLSRGDTPIPFTIALALWTKYQDQFTRGLQVPDPGGPKTIEPLDNPHEVYRYFLTHPDGGRTRRKKSGPPPDLFSMGRLALALDHKLILAHPNEDPIYLFEEVLEKAALVKLKGGSLYAGVFIGVEYYSHKLQGDYREYTRLYVDWLNKAHPVYKDFPLHFFPGSDTHGKFSPDRPLGLGHNYPGNKDVYHKELKEALTTKPKALSQEEQARLQRELEAWRQLREQRPPDLEGLRRKLCLGQ